MSDQSSGSEWLPVSSIGISSGRLLECGEKAEVTELVIMLFAVVDDPTELSRLVVPVVPLAVFAEMLPHIRECLRFSLGAVGAVVFPAALSDDCTVITIGLARMLSYMRAR